MIVDTERLHSRIYKIPVVCAVLADDYLEAAEKIFHHFKETGLSVLTEVNTEPGPHGVSEHLYIQL